MRELPRVAATASWEGITDALSDQGAVIVEDLLEDGLLERFNAELDPLLEGASPNHDNQFINPGVAVFFGEHTRHVTGVAAKSTVFSREILVHPVYRAVCETILLPHCARYQLNLAHVLDRGPGAPRQYLHRDELVWIHAPKDPDRQLQLASVIALVDFTADNGATVIAPGSHRWAPGREAREDELVAAEMPAGSAVIYVGSTIHGGGANRTADAWRRGMHLSFCLGWLRTEENNYLATPPEVARHLPTESLELLGYAAHDAVALGGGYLGTVELRDPVELLTEGSL